MATERNLQIPTCVERNTDLLTDPQTPEEAAAWLEHHRLPRDHTVELEDGFRHGLGAEGFEQISVDFDPATDIWELRAVLGRTRHCRNLVDLRACVERITGVMHCHIEANRFVVMMLRDEVGAAFMLDESPVPVEP